MGQNYPLTAHSFTPDSALILLLQRQSRLSYFHQLLSLCSCRVEFTTLFSSRRPWNDCFLFQFSFFSLRHLFLFVTLSRTSLLCVVLFLCCVVVLHNFGSHVNQISTSENEVHTGSRLKWNYMMDVVQRQSVCFPRCWISASFVLPFWFCLFPHVTSRVFPWHAGKSSRI